MATNTTLTMLTWGMFFVLIGVSWVVGSYYGIPITPYVSFGAGLILIGLNVARTRLGVRQNKITLFIGIIAMLFGGASILGYELPLLATIIILIGLFIIAEAAREIKK